MSTLLYFLTFLQSPPKYPLGLRLLDVGCDVRIYTLCSPGHFACSRAQFSPLWCPWHLSNSFPQPLGPEKYLLIGFNRVTRSKLLSNYLCENNLTTFGCSFSTLGIGIGNTTLSSYSRPMFTRYLIYITATFKIQVSQRYY